MTLTRSLSGLSSTAMMLALTLTAHGAAPVEANSAQSGAPSPAPKALVKARLIAGATAVVPGQPLPIGVDLTIAPGWHIYWLHPGDAGISTEVRWKAPPGVKIDGPRWPAPTRFDQFEGAIQALGYSGGVILPATVTVVDAQTGKLELSAQVSWLACHDDCVKGGATVGLELPVSKSAGAGVSGDGDGAAGTTPDAARIADFEARVPTPLNARDPFQIDVAAPPTALPGGTVPLTVEVRPKDAGQVRLEALYVNARPGQGVGHEQRESERRLRVDLKVDADSPPPAGARLAEGVAQVRVSGPGGESVRYVQLEFPTRLKSQPKTKPG